MTNISEIPSARPEDVGMDGDRLSRINDRMAAHIDQGNIQGAVTAVARGGRVVHFEAHGEKDTRDNTSMPEDALFRMASSTKPVSTPPAAATPRQWTEKDRQYDAWCAGGRRNRCTRMGLRLGYGSVVYG